MKCVGIYFYVNVKNRPMNKKNNKVRKKYNNESFKT